MIGRLKLGAAMAALLIGCGTVALAEDAPLNAAGRDTRDVREAVLSPDGARIAAVFSASTAEGGQTHVWLLSTDGRTAARQLTFSGGESEAGERAAAWSNDGATLFFMAKRGKANRLYRLPMTGGEAQGLTLARPATGTVQSGWGKTAEDAVDAQVQRYELSSDDRYIALIAADGETSARDGQIKKKDDAVRVGHDDVKKSRLYLVGLADGAAREVELPDQALSAHFNPKGDELVVVTAPADDDPGPAARGWRVPVAGGAPVEVAALPKSIQEPLFAPGGLLYQAQCQDEAPPGCNDLYAYDFATKASRNLTHGLKGTLLQGMTVEKDGKTVVVSVQDGVRERLARIDLASGALSWIDAPQPVALAASPNRAETGWAMLASGPNQPRSVFFTKALGQPAVRLDGPAIVPADWTATPSQTVHWKNGRMDLEGLLYLPAKPAPGGKTPLVVLVHGGPTGVWQDRYYNIVTLMAAQGWAVFMPNPRGSTGYGAAFMAANRNDLGGGDYTDIMTGVDAVLARYPLDSQRMALVGYSYGGEMAGFVEGRTGRFKALVSGAPVIDQFSEYGTEDSSYYDRWFYGRPWEHFADVWRQSPLARVGQAKTPMLLIQGEDDPTDPLGQSQEMYRALRQVGAPVTLVTYPRETHATLGRGFLAEPSREPWHGLDARRRMLAFIADSFAGKDPTKDK